MPLAPQYHLKSYRVNAGQNQIIFGVAGSNINVVNSTTISSGGSYTSSPSVTISGGGGSNAFAVANMGINSVTITPSIIPGAISPTVASISGSGASLTPVYGGADISTASNVYFNPSAAPTPTIGITGGGGATYSMTYSVAKTTFAQPGTVGSYSSEPTLTVTPAGSGFAANILYGFASITVTAGTGQSNLFETNGSVPEIQVPNSPGEGFIATSTYAPRLFTSVGGSVNLYWHTADAAPTISVVSGWAVGTGSAFALKFGIHELQVDNVGNGDYDDIVDIEVGGVAIGTISYDVNGDLDPGTISIDSPNYGYFGTSGVPTITLVPRGNGTGGAMSVSKCRVKRIEAAGGSGYTAADIDNFQDIGRLTSTSLRNSAGSSVQLDTEPFRLLVAERLSTTISSAGSGYEFSDTLSWDNGTNWVTVAAGVMATSTAPAISSTKRITGVDITNGGSFSTAPSFSFSPPSSGTTPTLSLNSVLILSITNTARGSGYGASQTVAFSGMFKDQDLAQAATGSDFIVSGPWLASISVTQPGVGYSVGDVMQSSYSSGSVSTLRVVSLNVTNTGGGFTSAPSISFSGGGQTVSAAATATIGLVSAATSALPLMTAAMANPSTGDARKIAYAITDCLFNIFNSNNAGVRVTATRSYSSPSGQSSDRTVSYRFSFVVRKSGDYAVKNEP